MLVPLALKRCLPNGLLQAQAACSTHLSLETATRNERFHSDGAIRKNDVFPCVRAVMAKERFDSSFNILSYDVAATGSSSLCFTVPTLFNASMCTPDNRKRLDQSPAMPLHSLALTELLGARRVSNRLAPSFASSRSFHALTRPSPLGFKGLGLVQSDRMAPATSSSALQLQQTRSLSEGELIGAAYLMTTDIMFWSGLIGAVVFRRNLIVMLLCTEIVMLACNMNFLFASAYLNDMTVSEGLHCAWVPWNVTEQWDSCTWVPCNVTERHLGFMLFVLVHFVNTA